jgi:putative membrane protein
MREISVALPLAALALCAAACGSSRGAMQPEVPSDVTTTTGATAAAASPNAPLAAPAAPGSEPPTLEAASVTPADNGYKDATTRIHHAAAPLSDAEIAAVAEAEGLGERQQAREATRRARSERVRQLAHLIATDRSHGRLEHVESVMALTPEENPTSADLRLSQTHVAERLRSASDGDFDRAYVDAEVDEIRQFVHMLDAQLIPQSQNLELRQALQAVRTAAASHLGMAEDIRASMRR